jgi:hypothetical protein
MSFQDSSILPDEDPADGFLRRVSALTERAVQGEDSLSIQRDLLVLLQEMLLSTRETHARYAAAIVSNHAVIARYQAIVARYQDMFTPALVPWIDHAPLLCEACREEI